MPRLRGFPGAAPGRGRARLALAADYAVAVLALSLGLLRDARRIPGLGDAGPGPAPPDYWLHPTPTVIVGIHVLAAVGLLARRHRPYAVALVLAALGLVVPTLAATFVTYAVARYGRGLLGILTTNAVVTACLVAGGGLGGQVGQADWTQGDPYSVPLVTLALTSTGLYLRARGDLVESLERRAAEAQRQQSTLAELARLRERHQLAVELHDEVTHWVTLATLASGAVAAEAGAREQSADPTSEITEIRDFGERALVELHRMTRTLTSGEEPSGPPPASRPDPTPEPARRVLLAVIDEGLRNAQTHAPGSAVRVVAGADDAGLHVVVVNDRPPDGSPRRDAHGGFGLAEVARRCRAVGGRLDHGVDPDGGYRLTASIPDRPGSSMSTRAR